MYSSLSPNQKKILEYNKGTVVVKACPGSGKTYSLAARISKLLREKEFKKQGIAIISFTNIACIEIEEKLKNEFKTSVPLKEPNFLGTIDSFINNFIFLPFGHLIMGCKERPELVGEPHSSWSVKKHEHDYDQYFDKTTFNISGHLIQIAPYQAFPFTWNYYNIDGSINGIIQNIIDSKNKYFGRGYANQSDANYIAMKVLEKYPLIAENIANKFEYLMIDECQDTNDVQMKIIELLNSSGAKNIMLIGDKDQSIFEWNNANPELFDEKYKIWDKIILNENRRSSQKICDFITNLSSFDSIIAVSNEVKDDDNSPQIKGYAVPKNATKKEESVIIFQESKESFQLILQDFITQCEKENIPIKKDSVAVLYRGKTISKYLGLKTDIDDYNNTPWIQKQYYVKAIIKGKHLFENGEIRKGYKLLEKGFFESFSKSEDENFYCSNEYIKNKIESIGIKKYRKSIFKFIESLPPTKDKTINQWVTEANVKLSSITDKIKFNINADKGNVLIDDFFGDDLNSESLYPFYFGTVHSVKGKTFEAVLLLLGKKSGKNYENIINAEKSTLEPKYLDEIRIVYVGISRPRKILVMAVPNSDVVLWKTKMATLKTII